MRLEEPVVDFTPILLTSVVSSATCDQDTTKRGSVETCMGEDADSNCSEDVDWL